MPDDASIKGPGRGPGGACPICSKPAERAWRPFCSKRCADVDLGRWLGGGYAIPGDPVTEAVPEAGSDSPDVPERGERE